MDINKICAEFERDFEVSVTIEKTLNECICDIMKQKNWDIEDFLINTDLDPMTFSRLTKKPNYTFKLKTVVTICLAFHLSTVQTEKLIKKIGLVFIPMNRTHAAYIYLLDKLNHLSIKDCNKILKNLGIPKKDLLGTIERKTI